MTAVDQGRTNQLNANPRAIAEDLFGCHVLNPVQWPVVEGHHPFARQLLSARSAPCRRNALLRAHPCTLRMPLERLATPSPATRAP
jgi:hypothetical protein